MNASEFPKNNPHETAIAANIRRNTLLMWVNITGFVAAIATALTFFL